MYNCLLVKFKFIIETMNYIIKRAILSQKFYVNSEICILTKASGIDKY